MALALVVFAQSGSAQKPASRPDADEGDVVRITTNLVQIDLVVTDSQGRQVTDLTANDFEIFEEGRPKKITNFSFVANEQSPASLAATATERSSATTSANPVSVPRRTMAIVIDDLKMSLESVVYTRRAIKKFIDERMQPGDLVAIVRTSGGIGVLQQFTSDKRQLYAALEHIRRTNDTVEKRLSTSCENSFALSLDRTVSAESEFDGYSEQSASYATLGALNFIMRGLKELPGRKSVVLFSDGLIVCPQDLKRETNIHDLLRKLSDLANRASAVVYHIDPRGLITLGSAADGGSGGNPAAAERLSKLSAAIFSSQGSFNPVVYATGGFSVYNNNDVSAAFQRVVDDQKGYYLIGYRPGDATFESAKGHPRFNNLKVKLNRPGLTVRTRAGFFSIPENNKPAQPHTRQEQLSAALIKPFNSGDIDVRLTSLFGNTAGGSFVLSMLHIDPAGLTFTKQPDGWQQAVMDVLAITFDADGQVVEQVNRTQTIRATGDKFQRLMKGGLVYSLSVPAKEGAYQLRIAVRDAASGRVGSANQFIEVPDIESNRLTLSGIAVHETELKDQVARSPNLQRSTSAFIREPQEPTYEPLGSPAMRRFHQNSELEYDYVIYNAIARDGAPQLKTRVTISRGPETVLVGAEKVFDATGQADLKRLDAGGRLLLGELPPGEYVLKITVVDQLAKGPAANASQWINFEIVK